MMHLIIVGSRDFDNYSLLVDAIDRFIVDTKSSITIISGTAKGADRLGEKWAKDNKQKLKRFTANWDKYGKSAGYKRNIEMAKIATHCICFWDGKSKGTKHMINIAKNYKLKIKIVLIKQDK